jgi:hypothetical protein
MTIPIFFGGTIVSDEQKAPLMRPLCSMPRYQPKIISAADLTTPPQCLLIVVAAWLQQQTSGDDRLIEIMVEAVRFYPIESKR